jgi:ribulose-phosphate 3-epimerase
VALAGVVKLAPSILAADFARLGEQIREVDEGGADRIHIDVMDGAFVPNISFGMPVIQSVRKVTKLPFEVHLMIEGADRYLDAFVKCGADSLIVHQEDLPHLHRTIQRIRELGVGAGVAINPATPASTLEAILPDLDLVLVMTVNPGFGGQKFIDSTLQKIAQVRRMIDDVKPGIEIEVDGGIDPETAPRAVEAGATVLVAGSSIFGTGAPVEVSMSRLLAGATAGR